MTDIQTIPKGPDTLLTIKGLTKTFGGLVAVSDFSMDVRSGEIKGLIGPNGAGKTTIVNLISGFYRPDSGQIFFEGNVITNEKADKRVARGIARTFQQIRMSKGMSVLEEINTAFFLQTRYSIFDVILQTPRFLREEQEKVCKALEILEILGIADFAEEISEDLPFGIQRKVSLARSLALKPQLLLLDEPASGLNPKETKEFIKTLFQIKDIFSLTIVLIEHDMSVIMEACDSVIAINYGAKIGEGTPKEIQKNPEVIRAYLGGTE